MLLLEIDELRKEYAAAPQAQFQGCTGLHKEEMQSQLVARLSAAFDRRCIC